MAFSYEITNPDDLFIDAELRTSLQSSAIALVRTKIVVVQNPSDV